MAFGLARVLRKYGLTWLVISQWAAIIALTLPLRAAGYLGLSARYLADDYCTAGTLIDLGFWGSQRYWYLHWSGRYAFTFFVNLLEMAGPGITRALPGIFLALWLLALTLFFRSLPAGANSMSWRAAILTAISPLVGIVLGMPDRYQSLIWFTGLLTYTVPLVILTALAAWSAQRWEGWREQGFSWRSGLVVGTIALVSGGFSETLAIMQIAGFALIALVGAALLDDGRRKMLLSWSFAGLVGSLLAMLIIWLAPGNATRQGLMPEPASLPSVAWRSLWDAYIYARGAFEAHWLPSMMVLLVSLHAALAMDRMPSERLRPWCREDLLLLGSIPIMAFLLTAAVMFPSEYATSSYPSGRVLVTAELIRNTALAAFGILLGRLFASRPALRSQVWTRALWALTLLAITSTALIGVRAILSDQERLFRFAALWDERHAFVQEARAAGQMDLAVRSLPHLAGLGEIGASSDHWVNRCFAQYYDLHTVRAK